MEKLNILFLGGAKRVSMARHFKRAARALGREAVIFSYEINRDLPISTEGTVIQGVRYGDSRIYDDMRRVCEEHDIHIIVPFIDGMIDVADNFARMDGVHVFSPTCAVAAALFDKVTCAALFDSHAIPAPATWGPGQPVVTPLIAKPRRGSASQGIRFIDSEEDLEGLDLNEYLIQERIDNRRELTVDCYSAVRSADIQVCACVPRVRNEVAGGEVVRTTVIHWDRATELVRDVIAKLHLRGAVTVQLIHDLDRDTLTVMEINPRLGGGAVASVCAGADLPAMIIAEALGRPAPVCADWQDMVVARYLDEVAFPINK